MKKINITETRIKCYTNNLDLYNKNYLFYEKTMSAHHIWNETHSKGYYVYLNENTLIEFIFNADVTITTTISLSVKINNLFEIFQIFKTINIPLINETNKINIKDPIKQEWGDTSFCVRDPWLNELTFFQRI